jgi:hypothetical protein
LHPRKSTAEELGGELEQQMLASRKRIVGVRGRGEEGRIRVTMLLLHPAVIPEYDRLGMTGGIVQRNYATNEIAIIGHKENVLFTSVVAMHSRWGHVLPWRATLSKRYVSLWADTMITSLGLLFFTRASPPRSSDGSHRPLQHLPRTTRKLHPRPQPHRRYVLPQWELHARSCTARQVKPPPHQMAMVA